MNGIDKIYQTQQQNVALTSTQPAIIKTNPMPNDKVELSTSAPGSNTNPQPNQAKDNTGFAKVAALVGGITVAAVGATFGGMKVYEKFFQKLKCGIKKGEINDAFYNFIRRNDPEGKLFNNSEQIKALNEKLTDDKFLILKQLTKMKENKGSYYTQKPEARFNLSDISELLSSTNETNIKYLERLANKTTDKWGCPPNLTTSEMVEVLQRITPENEKVAAEAIDIMDLGEKSTFTHLKKVLSDVNKDNIDTYQLLLNTRKKGAHTSLSLKDISAIAHSLQKTNNPKCAEFFLNMEKNNGTGLYKYDIEDLQKILKYTDDGKIDLYKKMFNIESVQNSTGTEQLLKGVNEHNIDLIDTILTKKYNSSVFNEPQDVFSNYDEIQKMLSAINGDNKEIAAKLIDRADSSYVYVNGSSNKASQCIACILDDISKNPENKASAEKIFKKLEMRNPKFDLDDFADQYLKDVKFQSKIYD